jgi:hypothetical protein
VYGVEEVGEEEGGYHVVEKGSPPMDEDEDEVGERGGLRAEGEDEEDGGQCGEIGGRRRVLGGLSGGCGGFVFLVAVQISQSMQSGLLL